VAAAIQIPDGLESSRTNIASDHGVWNERRSIARTAGRSLYASRLRRISVKPKLRVRWSQVGRLNRLGPNGGPDLGEPANVPRPDPVRRIRFRNDLDARGLQFTAKA
jgi:hypothetical protein